GCSAPPGASPVSGRPLLAAPVSRPERLARGGPLARLSPHLCPRRLRPALCRSWPRPDPDLHLPPPSPTATTDPALAHAPPCPAGRHGGQLGPRPGLAAAGARRSAAGVSPGRHAPVPGREPAAS